MKYPQKYPCFVCGKPNESENEVFGTDDNFGMHYVGGDCFRKVKRAGPAGLEVANYGRVYADREWAVAAGPWDACAERDAFSAWWESRDSVTEAEAWERWQSARTRIALAPTPEVAISPSDPAEIAAFNDWWAVRNHGDQAVESAAWRVWQAELERPYLNSADEKQRQHAWLAAEVAYTLPWAGRQELSLERCHVEMTLERVVKMLRELAHLT